MNWKFFFTFLWEVKPQRHYTIVRTTAWPACNRLTYNPTAEVARELFKLGFCCCNQRVGIKCCTCKKITLIFVENKDLTLHCIACTVGSIWPKLLFRIRRDHQKKILWAKQWSDSLCIYIYIYIYIRGVSELRIRIRIRGYPHEFWHPYPHPQYFMRMSCGYRKW